MRLEGSEAIEWVRKHGGRINKYNDPMEPAIEDISIDFAIEVATEDPSLIWAEVETERYAASVLGRKGGAVRSEAKRSAVQRNSSAPRPRNYTHAAHYQGGIVYLEESFDLRLDYEHPKSHRGRFGDRWVRVIVDHEATGTGTPGTGDTMCRSIPRGWKSGDR